jgi:hypothetical protein
MHAKPLSEFLGLRVTFSPVCGNRKLKSIQSLPGFGPLSGRSMTHGLLARAIKAKTLDGAMVKLDIIDPYRNDAPVENCTRDD